MGEAAGQQPTPEDRGTEGQDRAGTSIGLVPDTRSRTLPLDHQDASVVRQPMLNHHKTIARAPRSESLKMAQDLCPATFSNSIRRPIEGVKQPPVSSSVCRGPNLNRPLFRFTVGGICPFRP